MEIIEELFKQTELIIERITCKLRIEEADILIKEIRNYYESSKGEIMQEKKSEDKEEKDYGKGKIERKEKEKENDKGKRRIIQHGELEECYKNINIYYYKKCGFKGKAEKWIRKQRNEKFMCCNIESSKRKEKGELKKINNLGIYECCNNIIGGKKQREKYENRNGETTSICMNNRKILGIFDDHKDHNHTYIEIGEKEGKEFLGFKEKNLYILL
ncbi:hypothetical protein C1645_841019 [Glomus cerebriforme]|uniref:Uncharacterized protein n=1 Tax=Glomus cerebriforme TaxID=658196 RepID=A0A397RYI0_9GLOM|nr:hypothetical protein C1645_841019 [Glomus cerebriforme]